MTCETCKWWGTRTAIEQGVEFHACESQFVFRTNYGPNKIATSSGILTCDEGGGTNELWSAKDFGCIHHSPK